jgi:hypothetical protein
MTGDGILLNRDTGNWAPWTPKVGNNDDALEMIRAVTAMRRGPGRDFLVYGRMQHLPRVSGVALVEWQHNGRKHTVPAVVYASWQAPDGRYGVVLANWTTESRSIMVAGPRLGKSATVHLCGRQSKEFLVEARPDGFCLTLPPLSCVLIGR